MNTNTFLILGILFTFLTSCMPIRHSEVVSRHSDIDGSYYNNSLLIWVNQEHWLIKYTIDQENSFVIGPSQTKYKVKITPHKFDLESNFKYPRQRVYILDSDGNEISYWSNGNYQLFLSLTANDQIIVKELEVIIKTNVYSPLSHGAPN